MQEEAQKEEQIKMKMSLIKGTIWEALGVVILLFLFRNAKICVLYVIIRIVLFYFYDILWKKIDSKFERRKQE